MMLNVGTSAEAVAYRDVPALYARRPQAEGRPLESLGSFAGVGTGGIASVLFLQSRAGYAAFELITSESQTSAVLSPAQLIEEVQAGFGRTFSRLPEVFGVSRQTLYNWRSGELPKEHHRSRLQELAAAARVFRSVGFKPEALSLDRTVAEGKSLLQLVRDGGSGDDAAHMLVELERRGANVRARLDDMLGLNPAHPDGSAVTPARFITG